MLFATIVVISSVHADDDSISYSYTSANPDGIKTFFCEGGKKNREKFEKEAEAWMKEREHKILVIKCETLPMGGKSFQVMVYYSYYKESPPELEPQVPKQNDLDPSLKKPASSKPLPTTASVLHLK